MRGHCTRFSTRGGNSTQYKVRMIVVGGHMSGRGYLGFARIRTLHLRREHSIRKQVPGSPANAIRSSGWCHCG